MTDTTVKFLHSGMSGAPVLSGTAGALTSLLDACLVNGWGTGNADSVVIAGNIATVTRSTGHPFEVGSVALIAGATVTGGSINGEQKVLSITATTFTFATTGLSDQTATGTTTYKLAPLGWSNTAVAAGTNVKAYKSTDVAATGMLLRVDDTGTNNGRVVGYESMSDINTGTGPFPTSAQVSGGLYVPKSDAVSAAARGWVLVGDGRMFYFFSEWNTTSYATLYGSALVFGDYIANKSPDAYGCVLHAVASNQVGAAPGSTSLITSELGHSNPTLALGTYPTVGPRSYTALGSSIQLNKGAAIIGGANASVYSGGSGIAYPNPTDGGLFLTSMHLLEVNNALRGRLPGYYYVNQSVGASVFVTKDSVTGVTGLTDRVLRAIKAQQGVSFVDTTGPWR